MSRAPSVADCDLDTTELEFGRYSLISRSITGGSVTDINDRYCYFLRLMLRIRSVSIFMRQTVTAGRELKL